MVLKDLFVLVKCDAFVVLVSRDVEGVKYFTIVAVWIPGFVCVLKEAFACLLIEHMFESVVVGEPVAV